MFPTALYRPPGTTVKSRSVSASRIVLLKGCSAAARRSGHGIAAAKLLREVVFLDRTQKCASMTRRRCYRTASRGSTAPDELQESHVAIGLGEVVR